MNHEPRHRAAGEGASRDLIEAYLADLKQSAPSPEAAHRIDHVYERQGEPFAVYLTLNHTDRYAEGAEANFRRRYVGRYQDRDALIAETIESRGWQADLDRMLHADPQLRAMVTFDHSRFQDYIDNTFDVVDLDGGLYVFERPT